MCGLVGIASPRPARDRLERAAARLAHRGPDDAGVYVGERCGLALRRLSIIDLAGGHQPICNEDGRVWLTCNGEIFSSPELRRELEAAGHQFRTQSDVEVIVHGYEEWGVDVVERLRGMFAFALWDVDRRRLLLARDPFGIKPLYYAEHGEDLAFASEIRPLLHLLPELPRTANRDALWRLFEVGFVPSPLTAFSGVYKVPAAHTLVHEAGRTSLRRYWSAARAPMEREHSTDRAGAAVEFAEHLREAVEAWRLSDVPIAALLSGGVDSASLAALLSEPGEAPVHTFSSVSVLTRRHMTNPSTRARRLESSEAGTMKSVSRVTTSTSSPRLSAVSRNRVARRPAFRSTCCIEPAIKPASRSCSPERVPMSFSAGITGSTAIGALNGCWRSQRRSASGWRVSH